jgi:hypothetical protein
MVPDFVLRELYTRDPVVRTCIDHFLVGNCTFDQAMIYAVAMLVSQKEEMIRTEVDRRAEMPFSMTCRGTS